LLIRINSCVPEGFNFNYQDVEIQHGGVNHHCW
jgi:hypothetical protein